MGGRERASGTDWDATIRRPNPRPAKKWQHNNHKPAPSMMYSGVSSGTAAPCLLPARSAQTARSADAAAHAHTRTREGLLLPLPLPTLLLRSRLARLPPVRVLCVHVENRGAVGLVKG